MWGSDNRCAPLLHGSMADSSTWRVDPSLAEHGYRVIALHLPGHGASPANPGASVESHAAAVLSDHRRGRRTPVAAGSQSAARHGLTCADMPLARQVPGRVRCGGLRCAR
ncbi:alpha/beta fold hydrolase [Oryzihumus sp.]